jgi:hypothetical protein
MILIFNLSKDYAEHVTPIDILALPISRFHATKSRVNRWRNGLIRRPSLLPERQAQQVPW